MLDLIVDRQPKSSPDRIAVPAGGFEEKPCPLRKKSSGHQAALRKYRPENDIARIRQKHTFDLPREALAAPRHNRSRAQNSYAAARGLMKRLQGRNRRPRLRALCRARIVVDDKKDSAVVKFPR
ncbi:hypothetical protein [Bradyrhizobium sp. RDI18]|uniref:hypothetical protein n=1 Tax=Bradyrhizobium sp. RDI18 TaxID=3367400 RepID=UPI0037103771